MSDDRDHSNFFARFRKQVDNQISQAVGSILKGKPGEANNVSQNEVHGSRGLDTPHPFTQAQEPSVPEPEAEWPTSRCLGYIADRLRVKSIQSWSEFSAYSPRNLLFLPQPVPRDAPAGSAGFTFHDAFEDLLAISSGNSLKDLAPPPWDARPFLRFPGHHFSREWASELERRRLWDAYFPPLSFADDARPIFDEVEAVYGPSSGGSEAIQANQAAKFQHSASLIRDASMCPEERMLDHLVFVTPFGRPTSPGMPDFNAPFDPDRTSAVLTELDKLFNPWAESPRLEQPHTSHATPETSNSPRNAWEATPEAPRRQPDTMEDLFLALTSDLGHIVAKSFSSLWKIMDGTTSYQDLTANTEPGNSQTTETVVSADGSKSVKNTEQHVQDGMTKHTVTSEQYDTAGNLVQRTVTVRTFSTTDNKSTSGLASVDEHGENQSSDGQGQETRKTPQNGWFWTGK